MWEKIKEGWSIGIKGLLSIGLSYVSGIFVVKVFKIEENLYQSGHVEGYWSWLALRIMGIQGIVDLEGDLDPRKVRKYLKWYHHWKITDGPLPDIDKLWDVADMIFAKTYDMKVLVHCMGGVNRSSLVNGCVLYLMGFSGEEIVKKIRDRRPGALSNKVFEKFLLDLDKSRG